MNGDARAQRRSACGRRRCRARRRRAGSRSPGSRRRRAGSRRAGAPCRRGSGLAGRTGSRPCRCPTRSAGRPARSAVKSATSVHVDRAVGGRRRTRLARRGAGSTGVRGHAEGLRRAARRCARASRPARRSACSAATVPPRRRGRDRADRAATPGTSAGPGCGASSRTRSQCAAVPPSVSGSCSTGTSRTIVAVAVQAAGGRRTRRCARIHASPFQTSQISGGLRGSTPMPSASGARSSRSAWPASVSREAEVERVARRRVGSTGSTRTPVPSKRRSSHTSSSRDRPARWSSRRDQVRAAR